MNKKLLLIIIVIAVVIGITYLVLPRQINYQDGLYPVNEEIEGETIIMQNYVRIPVDKDDISALEATKKHTTVETQNFDFGVFVKSVNGQIPDDKHFWKLYLNGNEAQVGASDLLVKKGDVIEWRLETIMEN